MAAQGKGARRDVSIHAPAKGATDEDEYFADYEQVSIHAPARGATSKLLAYGVASKVSIHAPARGATIGKGISLD